MKLRLSPIQANQILPMQSARSSVPTRSSMPRFARAPPRLRVLARTGVGVDHVDLQAATARGIPVVITPGSGTRAVAEGVFALALHLVKRLGPSTELVRQGRWADRGQLSLGDLDGATIGIVGYGRIGWRVGELATAFGMHVLA
jgi:D-3-phosphoglycerate dehydrogenase / 2-oxoglutarate reductase